MFEDTGVVPGRPISALACHVAFDINRPLAGLLEALPLTHRRLMLRQRQSSSRSTSVTCAGKQECKMELDFGAAW